MFLGLSKSKFFGCFFRATRAALLQVKREDVECQGTKEAGCRWPGRKSKSMDHEIGRRWEESAGFWIFEGSGVRR